jgi:hypothetical protein
VTRALDVVNGFDALSQNAELIQPPENVVAAVASRQPGVTTDGQRYLPSGPLNFVSQLDAGGRGAHHQDAARRQLIGTAVVRGHHLQD